MNDKIWPAILVLLRYFYSFCEYFELDFIFIVSAFILILVSFSHFVVFLSFY